MVKRIYRWLVHPKIVKITILLNLFVFLPGLGLCILIAFLFGLQSYTIWDNYISDLGSISFTPAPNDVWANVFTAVNMDVNIDGSYVNSSSLALVPTNNPDSVWYIQTLWILIISWNKC